MAEKEKVAREKLGGELKLGNGLETILKDADVAVEWPSFIKLYDQLCAGIFLNKRTKKYWFDNKRNSNCFILFARALSIEWIENKEIWRWKSLEDSSNTIEVAELLNATWLYITGRIEASELSPRTWYEAVFVVMIEVGAREWHVPVNIELKKPDGTKQERKENLQDKPKGQWIEIFVGDFMVYDHENWGKFVFSLYETGSQLKNGLILSGVVIRAKG